MSAPETWTSRLTVGMLSILSLSPLIWCIWEQRDLRSSFVVDEEVLVPRKRKMILMSSSWPSSNQAGRRDATLAITEVFPAPGSPQITTGELKDIPWWRHQMGTFSALLALTEIHRSPVDSPHKGQSMTRSFDVFFDLRLNKRLSKKKSRRCWFETPSRSLWRHCNDEHASLWCDYYANTLEQSQENIGYHMTYITGISLCMRPANKRGGYNVTSSLIGWVHT